jgi:hypothetical protein
VQGPLPSKLVLCMCCKTNLHEMGNAHILPQPLLGPDTTKGCNRGQAWQAHGPAVLLSKRCLELYSASASKPCALPLRTPPDAYCPSKALAIHRAACLPTPLVHTAPDRGVRNTALACSGAWHSDTRGAITQGAGMQLAPAPPSRGLC